MMPVRIATRRSPLALAQSGALAAAIRSATGREVDLVHVESLGDRTAAPLREMGGVGVFVTAVREAVLEGGADLAVHSLKDLPTAPHPGVGLLAVPARESPRDALVSHLGGLAELPPGSRVATGSPRRRAQLLMRRPDLAVVDVRGNVDTRLGKLDRGDFEALLLAEAGLRRLGLQGRITEALAVNDMLPAPGQGALAVECADGAMAGFADIASVLDDSPTRAAVVCERAALSRLEAGCAAPMGAIADLHGGVLRARVAVFDRDGVRTVRTEVSGDPEQAERLGVKAAAELLDLGASVLLGESGS